MIHLPAPPQRSWLIGVWASLMMLLVVALGGVLTGLFGPGGTLLAVLLVLSVAAIGRIGDWRLARLAYRAWNRAAAAYAVAAGWFILRLCYYAIILPVGRCGSNLRLERRASVWTSPTDAAGRLSPTTSDRDAALREGWLRNYLRWAIGSGNVWALALVPFLAFLSAVGQSQADPDVPTNIYTLY